MPVRRGDPWPRTMLRIGPDLSFFTIALAQMNPTLGDISGNLAKARRLCALAAAEGADLLVFPELALTGWPLRRLAQEPAFLAEAADALAALQADSAEGGPALLVGLPWVEAGQTRAYNAVALLHRGQLLGWRAKSVLASAEGADERELFSAGPVPGPIALPVPGEPPIRLGVMIGQDLAGPDVAEALGETGAEILVVADAAPFTPGGFERRQQQAVLRVTETGLPLVQVNQVGGQDDRVFDGMSLALDAGRRLVALAPAFAEQLVLTSWTRPEDGPLQPAAVAARVAPLEERAALYQALVLALADHVAKNDLPCVVVDLAESASAALTLAIAVDALGAGRVRAVAAPDMAAVLGTARRLGVECDLIAADSAALALRPLLAPLWDGASAGSDDDAAAGGGQLAARIRQIAVDLLAGTLGGLVLSCTDRTDLALGTAYRLGGHAVLGDVDRSTVRALGAWRNAALPPGAHGPGGPILPAALLESPAEEEATDRLLALLIGQRGSVAASQDHGHDPAALAALRDRLVRAERQRRQIPAGVLVSDHAPAGRRYYPILPAPNRSDSIFREKSPKS